MKLASRGQRDLDTGPQAIDNSDEQAQLRRQARAVYAKSIVTAAILTAISLAL
ncbi:MAG TPA: hypothetical protein VJ840_13385 [Gemmatimonadaceae bacterium]|nr:hypothetical protein [Gemmatimonadaceae bacterium]